MERRWYIVLKKPHNMFTNTQSSKLVSSKFIPRPSTPVQRIPHAVKKRIKFLLDALWKAIFDILLRTEEDETINEAYGREKTERMGGEMGMISRRHVSTN